MEVDNAIKRANQITSSIKNFENQELDKKAEEQAEEDAFNKEDIIINGRAQVISP